MSWSTDGHGETFSKDRDHVFDLITSLELCNVIILSGDMHFGAAYRHNNGRVLEFSASPFQAFPFWPDSDPMNNKTTGYERIFIHGGLNFYFGKLTLNSTGGAFELFSWPLFLPQSEPAVYDSYAFPRNMDCPTNPR